MTDFYGDQQKSLKERKKKIQYGELKKTEFFKIANSQKFSVKISWIDPF